MYAGKRTLVTGGTGSFGQTMVRRMLAADVAEVRVLSRDEGKHDQMRVELADPRVRFYVGDVRDHLSVDRACRDVDMVFHAAALKQVPSCEFFPVEAVRTNVMGSDNVVRACEANGVPSLVFLSTDKAVYPINAMGMTKAMMEKVALSHGLNNPHARTVVSCVRYGNVMYSRGSVIPLFVRQLTAGRPITLTHPRMTRFMMSLADSVDLVEYAFTHAEQGDLFIRKAPACTLADLVTALGNLFGLRPTVEVIGIRHGEKMSESLASREELARAVDGGAYFRIPADNRDLNYGLYFDEGNTEGRPPVDYDSHTTTRLDVAGVERLLLTLPEIQVELGGAARAVA
jgi:UDP-N-acetylglucosamine 4,6-dehydratase/5-epimerase